jgi:translation initiation factor 3 subunit B
MSYFGWRPRPPTLLSADQQKEIRKNLRTYASKFEEADLRELSEETTNTAANKKRLMVLWNEWRRHCRREYETRSAKRKGLLNCEDDYGSDALPSVSGSMEVEEWIEEVVEETEEIIDQ